MEFFDCHCHTERSACAEDVSLAMYVERASQGAPPFVITDHSAHLFYPADMKWAFWGDEASEIFEANRSAGMARCADYVSWLRSAQTSGMLVGVELDVFYDGRLVFDPTLLPELDFIIGAVHGMRTLNNEQPLEQVVDELKTRTLHLAEAGMTALAHPFREWKQKNRDVPLWVIEWLVDTAADAGFAPELNCHYKVPEADLEMVKLCVERGVPIAIGTDTHRSYEFGDFSYHEEILQQAGIEPGRWETVLLPAPNVTGSRV
jgi:histidinol phosphatase-like PHP family hydrolase